MNNPAATALRAIAKLIEKQADAIDTQGVTVTTDKPILIQWGDELLTTDQAEERRRQEIAERMKAHDWVDLAAGTGGQAGDGDVPDDALLRAFGPFMAALTRASDPIQTDSAGERWTLQTIKKRAGVGPKSWGVVRDEIRAKWFTPWGVAWRADAANGPLVPKPEAVDALFSKEYA